MSATRAPLVAAIAIASFVCPAAAQDDMPESVVVSASRISLAGYEAPTPVTAIGAEEIARDAKIDIGDLIRELPSTGPSPSLNNGGNAINVAQGDAGLDTVALRNLGLARTLVLFDGQRVVSSNLLGGGVDLATLPATLVKRIDVVTGGASAAWGSDAVAGVVNLLLDKEFEGTKASLTLGDDTSFDHRRMALEGAFGTGFAGGRGHLVFSGNYTTSPDAAFMGQAAWWKGTALVRNPAYTPGGNQPLFVHQDHVGNIQVTQRGLIDANTAGGAGSTLAPNALVGLQFTGNGAVSPFHYGTIFGTNCYNGCTNNERTGVLRFTPLAVPYNHTTLFGYGSYQLTDAVRASLQLNYGLSGARSLGGPRQLLATIRPDNAYLDPSVAAMFGTLSNGFNAALGTPGTAATPAQALYVGTQNLNNMPATSYSRSQLCQTVGVPCNIVNRALMRAVFTLEGDLGEDWSWKAYYQHGTVRERQVLYNNSFLSRYNFATDAVQVTLANQGASGLPISSIQCRALLQGVAAAAGCQPLNILGDNVASEMALRYVNPGRDPSSGILNQETIVLNQDVLSGAMQGTLPLGLPAGPVAVAFGGEYRHEQGGVIHADAYGLAGQWAAGNFRPYRGQYHVGEGFLEVDAPILKDSFVDSLDANASGRLTDYSTSGMVQTWKLGLVSQVNDQVRLRTSWSLDIRAPQISELFSPGILSAQQCRYPSNSLYYQCFALQGGNSGLKPEKAVTVSGGVVLTPSWVEGLTLSADWYSINIHGAIDTVDFQTIIDRCLAGQQIYCPQLVFTGAGQPSQINVFPLNSAVDSASGLDFQANYTHPLLAGTMSWDLTGNYTDQQTRTAQGITYDRAGALGASPDVYASGVPKFRAVLTATYAEGPLSFTAQGRFIGSAVLSNGTQGVPGLNSASYVGGVLTRGDIAGLVDDNSIPAIAYLDLRASWQVAEQVVLYGAMDNVTNVAPPTIATTSGASFTNTQIYDGLGRSIRFGVRFAG
ncbi:MAG: TonB-dependent receptor [Alphaproteobacteria bacterium]|nr:TonB-dependent receptor [Alphaproteobacteria bacterium]